MNFRCWCCLCSHLLNLTPQPPAIAFTWIFPETLLSLVLMAVMKYLTGINLRVYFGSHNKRQTVCLSGRGLKKVGAHLSRAGSTDHLGICMQKLKAHCPSDLLAPSRLDLLCSYITTLPPPGIASLDADQALSVSLQWAVHIQSTILSLLRTY